MGGFWISIVLLVLVGLLAAAGMIAAKKPDAGAAIGKLVPFQGIIGVIALAWGVWSLIDLLSSGIGIGDMMAVVPIMTLLLLAGIALLIILGLLFGWSLIGKFAGGGAGPAQKLAGIQGPLGVLAIADAALVLVFYLFNIQM